MTVRFFPHSWLINSFVTRVTQSLWRVSKGASCSRIMLFKIEHFRRSELVVHARLSNSGTVSDITLYVLLMIRLNWDRDIRWSYATYHYIYVLLWIQLLQTSHESWALMYFRLFHSTGRSLSVFTFTVLLLTAIGNERNDIYQN
jgi:hypothetical protein